MMRLSYFGLLAGAALICGVGGAHAQVIGAYDNFDTFNDTGQDAEGFEIDVEDIAKSDLTREFPSNFSTTPWVIRYGLPTVTSYDWTLAAPDPAHSYDAGHHGVLITWAATWNGSQWLAQYGDQPFAPGVLAGNATPDVAHPTLTNGDSCWYYGLGAAYPTSGCDHFGISLGPNAVPGLISYHWKIVDPSQLGHLINGPLEASIPPTPVLAPNPGLPNAPPVIAAVAQAPEQERDPAVNPDLQFGTGYWVKVTTLYGAKRAALDKLQKRYVQAAKAKKVVVWSILQRAPKLVVGAVEHENAENDAIPAGDVQVTKQYEYFKFAGAYDSETHEVLCNPAVRCAKPTTVTYTVPAHGRGGAGSVTVPNGDLGDYLGAHVNAYDAK